MAFLLLLQILAVAVCVVPTLQAVIRSPEQLSKLAEDATPHAVTVPVGAQLTLCQCERATGYPNGLGCNKEGWFISGFERSGTWAGGGEVPLSHAVCCRLCLPDGIPTAGQPVGVVSTGCHMSTDKNYRQLSCDSGTEPSFATSFSHAEVANPFYADIFYPLGRTECCMPTLLMADGQGWQLERCNCEYVGGVDCGGMSTHKLLAGFASARVGRNDEYVPVAPQQCCGVCLGSAMKDLGDCSALGYCGNHGVCILGSCECDDGWSGGDCSQSGSIPRSGMLPAWLSWSIIAGGMLLMFASMLVLRLGLRLRRRRQADGDSDEGEQLQEPLLMRIAEEGSVGSQDTDVSDVDAQDLPGGLLASAVEGLAPSPDPLGGEEDEERGERQRRRSAAAGDIGAALEISGRAITPDPSPADGGGAESDGEGGEDSAKKSPPSPAGPMCCICIERPIQVALVPCGHASLCRRCSRRVDKCPFCRKEIARRQRIFYAQ